MEYKPRLIKKYHEEIVPALQKQFNYTSIMQVPRLKKISVNQGIGSATTDKKQIDTGIEEMTKITGQLAVSTKSKKDISNFKLRKGVPVGVIGEVRPQSEGMNIVTNGEMEPLTLPVRDEIARALEGG